MSAHLPCFLFNVTHEWIYEEYRGIGVITSLRFLFPFVRLKIITNRGRLILLYPTQGLAGLQQGKEHHLFHLLLL